MRNPRRLTVVTMLGLLVLTALTAGVIGSRDALAAPPPGPHGKPEPDMLGTHWAKDHAPPFGRGGTQLLSYHGGAVMSSGIQVQPIYWGTSWSSDTQAKANLLAAFYSGVSGTSYMRTNTANDLSSTVNKVGTAVSTLLPTRTLRLPPQRRLQPARSSPRFRSSFQPVQLSRPQTGITRYTSTAGGAAPATAPGTPGRTLVEHLQAPPLTSSLGSSLTSMVTLAATPIPTLRLIPRAWHR